MLVPGKSFPYRQINDEDHLTIMTYCGGPPVTKSEDVKTFLKFSGYPLLRSSHIAQLVLESLYDKSKSSLGIESGEGRQAFNTGAVFYSSVVNVVSQPSTVPFDLKTIARVGDRDSVEFAQDSSARIQDELPSFCDLVDNLSPIMGIGADKYLRRGALVGAGAVHILITESAERVAQIDVNSTDPEDLFSAHPELFGL